jgi:hypothetical protein
MRTGSQCDPNSATSGFYSGTETCRLPLACRRWRFAEKQSFDTILKTAVDLVVFASTDRRHVASKGTAYIRCLLNIFNGKGSR